MLYIQQGQSNTLTLSIVQNSRDAFTGYTLNFTHVMSSALTSYTIDTSDEAVYFANERYCQITLDLATEDLPYEGQYTLEILGTPNDVPVYQGFCMTTGPAESNPFTEYVSPNEDNANYIYIQD